MKTKTFAMTAMTVVSILSTSAHALGAGTTISDIGWLTPGVTETSTFYTGSNDIFEVAFALPNAVTNPAGQWSVTTTIDVTQPPAGGQTSTVFFLKGDGPDKERFFDFSEGSETFTDVVYPGEYPNYEFYVSSYDSAQFTVSLTLAVPEPANVAMLVAGMGMLGLAAARRRRN